MSIYVNCIFFIFFDLSVFAMQNEDGKVVDIYVPRKCSATNKLLHSKDHAAVQLNLGHVDQNGVYTGQYTTVALSGFVRKLGNSDDAVNR
jgi:small subunit ribosomal protein S21e